MQVKVKICGIKDLESAQAAIEYGADFLGFNFVPTSKRFISPEDVSVILNAIRPVNLSVPPPVILSVLAKDLTSLHPEGADVKIIGVFQNASTDEVNKIASDLNLDGVQLHGDETPEYCQKINSKVIIKALNLTTDFDVEEVKEKMSTFNIQYFLVDREIQGEGRMLNMQKVKTLAKVFPLFVGGGLNPSNVADVVKTTQPFAVDVAGGVETNGKKDDQKIEDFIKKAKGGKSS